ncbi:hypothetical protein ACIPQB_05640 [Caulobacter sp. LARHSG274]
MQATLARRAAAFAISCLASATGPVATAQDVPLAPRSFPRVGQVDPRFQAYNLDLIAITGMPPPKPASAAPSDEQSHADAQVQTVMSGVKLEKPLDLSNPRLRKLAAALGPAYLRTSGTSANSVYFQNDDRSAPEQPPAGYGSVLTRAQWKGVIDFARAVDAKLLMSFTVNTAVRDPSGRWTPLQAQPLVDYTHAIGGEIYAAELFNEPNLPNYGGAPKGYDGAWFARDQVAFRAFATKSLPNMKIVGPGDVVMNNMPLPGNLTGASLMTGEPTPRFDIISYHFYPAVAPRCAPASSPVGTSPDKALTEEWLGRTDPSLLDHKALRDRYAPGAPIWNTETAGAACSGAPWSATFIDSFRYVDQLGRLAKLGASAVFHQTLVGGNYGLLDPETFAPRPNYWAALLWRRTVGTTVLDAGPLRPDLHLYAHCQARVKGGVTVIAINTGTEPQVLDLGGKARLYALTATELQSATASLNGRPLALGHKDALPGLTPQSITGGKVTLAATSINFIALPDARNPACR